MMVFETHMTNKCYIENSFITPNIKNAQMVMHEMQKTTKVVVEK